MLRDSFQVVASPGLVRGALLPLSPAEILRLPLIEAGWPASDEEASTWQRLAAVASEQSGSVLPPLAGQVTNARFGGHTQHVAV